MTYYIIPLLLSLLYYIFGLHATSITMGNHKHHLPKYHTEQDFSVLKKHYYFVLKKYSKFGN